MDGADGVEDTEDADDAKDVVEVALVVPSNAAKADCLFTPSSVDGKDGEDRGGQYQLVLPPLLLLLSCPCCPCAYS
ncbi:hypothetical protein M378DRAFT_174275, partial [Amanita muscaria Koide BX008]